MAIEDPELIASLSHMRLEIGKLVGFLENLRYQVEKEKLDRNACKTLISDFRASLTNIKQ